MLKNIVEKNASKVAKKYEEYFARGEISVDYLRGVIDGLNTLGTSVLNEFHENDDFKECSVGFSEVADVVLDVLGEEGASLSELIFAEHVLDHYSSVIESMSQEDDEECEVSILYS